MNAKRFLLPTIILVLTISLGFTNNTRVTELTVEQKADSVLKLMTLDEKIGQTNLMTADMSITGVSNKNDFYTLTKEGKTGAILNAVTVDYLYKLQKVAVEQTRLHIPLLFGLDVVNGYKTIFPIPLAQACSWDMERIEKVERISAMEATSAGINWTFAPMVDVSREPRWGRVAECPGEDTWLACKIATARVKGFQGADLSADNTLLACAKHFAAYGAVSGGRDYNTVDMSDRTLLECYLPAYKACVDAGVGSVMSSFNEIAGVPSTCNKWLLTDVLRKKWGFKGFVVSDYTSVNELMDHGIASDSANAAEMSINAGLDMDMVSNAYLMHMKKLILEKKVSIELLDNAVRAILEAKFRLGLFDNPYKYLDKKREKENLLLPENIAFSREMQSRSCVLLKNDNQTLPIKKDIKSIAVIGPCAQMKNDLSGSNGAQGNAEIAISLFNGIMKKVGDKTKVNYAEGCKLTGTDESPIPAAIQLAKEADFIVLALGESREMSGESKSKVDISLPEIQMKLAREIMKIGKPVVVVLFNGRPLVIPELDNLAPAILESWLGGTQAGNGIADVLFGDYNPSGKLVMTFPRAVGQIPVYYNFKNTGRPSPNPKVIGDMWDWRSKYIDSPNAPLYPFGYGLSYTQFSYSDIKLNKTTFTANDKIVSSVVITNTGNYDGEEIVQLYIHDKVGSVTRPVKELKGYKKIMLKKGETQTVEFTLTPADLCFYGLDMTYTWEPGEFELFIGGSSDCDKKVTFSLKD
jgi:beta-glucosidase